MKSPLEMANVGTPEELFEHVPLLRKWLREMPEKMGQKGPQRWSTHALVRAAVEVFPLKGWAPVDGYFLRRNFEHAWLAKKEVQTLFILDLVPQGSLGGPLVVSMHHAGTANSSPWAELYFGDGARYAARIGEFMRDAGEIAQLGR